MRHLHAATLTLASVLVTCLPASEASARSQFGHHHRYTHAHTLARGGRAPAYAPPAPIGVGLFGTGLFYGNGLPDLGAFGF